MNRESPNTEKNMMLAFALSMAVLFGYSFLMQKLYPPQEQPLQEAPVLQEPLERRQPELLEKASEAIRGAANAILQKGVSPTIIPFENELYQVEFSTLGGTITRLYYKGLDGRPDTSALLFEGDPNLSGIFALYQVREEADLSQTVFKLNRKGTNQDIFEFVYEKPGEYRLVKEYQFGREESTIKLRILLENLSERTRHYPFEFKYGLTPDEKLASVYSKVENLFKTDKIEAADHGKLQKKPKSYEKITYWGGVVERYFALLVKPSWVSIASKANADETTVWGSLILEPITLGPKQAAREEFLIYAGPQLLNDLKAQGAEFERVLTRGMLGQVKVLLLRILNFIYGYTHNYGWAIILLTLLIKIVFAPLTHIGFQSSRKMQAIQPKLKAIQERYKNNPEKVQKETMQLFKRNKVNPLGGCLPMLIQLPIFFAMFRILPESIELQGAPFIFWMNDLSQPDRLFAFPGAIPLLGWDAFNVLPILMTVSQVFYQKVMPQATVSKEQQNIFKFMPIMIGFICYNMPSGLVLYWTAQNLMSIVHQFNANKIKVILHHEDQEEE